MNASDLNWLYVIGLVVLYWMVIAGTWMFRASRPGARIRARQRALAGSAIDPVTGEMTMTFGHAIALHRIAAILLLPPLLLVTAWLLALG